MVDTATIVGDDGGLILTSEAARLLGLSEGQVRNLADRGVLRCSRIGSLRVYQRSDVMRLRRAREVSAGVALPLVSLEEHEAGVETIRQALDAEECRIAER